MLAARRAPRPEDAAAGRRPAVRLLRGLRRAGDRRPRTASSRRRAATRSSSRAAARSAERAPRDRRAPACPVMGHVGLTPQTATALGGYRAQGRTAARAPPGRSTTRSRCRRRAASRSSSRRSRRAVADAIMPHMEIPVIGIGAGPATDGQVLVLHDLLGIHEGFGAKFVKRYASRQEEMVRGVAAYAEDVRTPRLPGARARLLDRRGRARARSARRSHAELQGDVTVPRACSRRPRHGNIDGYAPIPVLAGPRGRLAAPGDGPGLRRPHGCARRDALADRGDEQHDDALVRRRRTACRRMPRSSRARRSRSRRSRRRPARCRRRPQAAAAAAAASGAPRADGRLHGPPGRLAARRIAAQRGRPDERDALR